MNDKEAVIAALRNMARDRQYKNHRQGRTGGFFGGVLNPDPTVNLRPGRIWVREGADGTRAQSEALIVGVVDTVADIPVWLAETVEGGELCVLGPVVTTRNLESWGGGLPGTGVPRVPSVLATGYVKTDNILAGRVSPSTSHPASLYVTIGLFWAFGRLLGGIEHDVGSANVPGSANEHRWCMVCVDKDNSAYTLTGTEYVRTSANELLLDTTDVDIEIPAGYVPTGLVSLSYGQTDISESRFEDVRHWITSPSTLLSESAETLTLSSGAATADGGSYFILAAQTGTADDLDTLTVAGPPRVVLLQADSGDTITVKHSTGNIELNGEDDFALSGDKTLALFWDGANLSDIGAASPPATLTVEEEDGTPTVANVTKIVVSNGTLTDDGSGQVSLDLTAGLTNRFLAVYNYRNGTEPKIGLATSRDGRTFVRATEPLLTFGSGGAQDDSHLAHPCIVENDAGHLYLYYGGFDGTNYAVMLARSFDRGTTWTKYGTVLSASEVWEDSTVSWARVLYDREETDSAKRWKMWYVGDGGAGGIGYAYAADGLSWTKYASNPVVALGAGGTWDDAALETGDIIRMSNTYYLFYGGTDALVSPTWSMGYVTFTNPEGTYTKSADNPILVGDGISQDAGANIGIGDTSIQVTSAAVFPIGAPVWIYDNSSVTNKMLTVVTDRIDSTHIRIRDAAIHAFTTAQSARVRSAAYNSIVPIRVIYDGGWKFVVTAFQPEFWTSNIHEISMFAYSKDLTTAWIDYSGGMIIPITADESDLADVSFENPYIFDLQAWSARFQKEASDGATTSLNNLAAVAVNTSLISDTDSTDDLGSTSIYWANGYIDTLYLTEQAAPSTPASGKVVVYPKTDGKLYSKDDAGTEYDLTGSGGGITVAEADGTPSVGSVTTIVVTNGKLTDDGGGQVTLDLTGGVAGPYTAPPTTGWSWLNQGTSTIDSTSERQYLEAPANATFQIRGRYRDQPTVPYTITAAFKAVALDGNCHFGFLWFDGTTEAMTFGPGQGTSDGQTYRVWYKWTDYDSLSASYFNTTTPFWHLNPVWLRITDDNTNIKVWYSADGENFIEIGSQTRTDWLTPSKVGFFVAPGATNKASVTLLSWEET